MSRIALRHSFSNCGMDTAIGMQTIVYWYASPIKKPKYKKSINNFKNK